MGKSHGVHALGCPTNCKRILRGKKAPKIKVKIKIQQNKEGEAHKWQG